MFPLLSTSVGLITQFHILIDGMFLMMLFIKNLGLGLDYQTSVKKHMLTLLIIESFFVLCGEHMGWDASPIATSLGISGSNAPPKVPGKKKKKLTKDTLMGLYKLIYKLY